jgi:hypothetical protein
VKATVAGVFPEERGACLFILLNVRHQYEGRTHSATLRMGGYVEVRYEAGDVIVISIDPAHPETLLEK